MLASGDFGGVASAFKELPQRTAQIAAACERIQQTWTPKQREKRRVTALEEVMARPVTLGVASSYGITEPA